MTAWLWLGPLASLPVTAESALCIAVSAEPGIWDRDLSVTSQSAGPSVVPQGWPEEPRAAVHAEWREEGPEVTQATAPAPHPARQRRASAFASPSPCWAAGGESSAPGRQRATDFVPCGLLVCGWGGGRSTEWHFWSEGFLQAGFILAVFPLCHSGKSRVWHGSLHRVRRECTAEECTECCRVPRTR